MGGTILIFGGASNASYVMYRIHEEGELLDDLKEEEKEIPGAMCSGVTLLERGVLFAVGWRKTEGQWRSGIEVLSSDLRWDSILS